MKKLLGISLVAVLAATPLMAFAAAGEVVGTNNTPTSITPAPTGDALTAIKAGAPYYALATEGNNDDKAASAGYVKGAYNAAIKAVNAVHGEVTQINTDMGNKADADLSNVADGTVATRLLGNGAVTTDKIADSNVTTGKLADDAVTTAKIADSNVTTGKLADDAVITAKIANGAVTTDKIADGTILVEDVNANAVSTGTQANAVNDKLTTQGYVDQAVAGINTNITNNLATKTEVTANINGATGSKTGVSLTVDGTPTGTVAGSLANTAVTVSATLPDSVSIMNVWGSDTPTTLALNDAASATTLNGNVTNGAIGATFTGTGIDSGTATGDIDGITITAPTYIEDL